MKRLKTTLFGSGLSTTALGVNAGDFGSATEAKAMLTRAAAAVKADKAGAFAKFTKGEDGFKDRDLYPFCGGPDGLFSVHPKLAGKSLKELLDKKGKQLGAAIYAPTQEGKLGEVDSMWPRPGTEEPVKKVSYVTRIGDPVCVVGYYP